ncbi:hypothetical protein [Lysobacter gummosus]
MSQSGAEQFHVRLAQYTSALTDLKPRLTIFATNDRSLPDRGQSE